MHDAQGSLLLLRSASVGASLEMLVVRDGLGGGDGISASSSLPGGRPSPVRKSAEVLIRTEDEDGLGGFCLLCAQEMLRGLDWIRLAQDQRVQLGS